MIGEIQKGDANLCKLLPLVKVRSDIAYIPSQFTLSFSYHGKSYLFNTLTKQFVEGLLPLSAVAGEGYDELIAARFLVPADKDECAFYSSVSRMMRTYDQKQGIRNYTILPTLACNARCVYCYEQGMAQTSMTPEVWEQTVRYILETCCEEELELWWFGGEPLLCAEAIDYICKKIREAQIRYHSCMTSNGSLITPDIVKKMKNDWNLKRIQISLDGDETAYIDRKRYYTYQDYYHTVIKAINELSASGIHVSVRCNVDENNWDGTARLLQDLKDGISNKEKASFYFAPLFQVKTSENEIAMWRKIEKARSAIEAAGFKSATVSYSLQSFRTFHCMVDSGNAVVIMPDGGLNPCEHCPPEARYGDIWNGVTNKQVKETFARTDMIKEECRTCPFLPNCTSFANCPIQEKHCREVQQFLTVNALKRMLDKREKENERMVEQNFAC